MLVSSNLPINWKKFVREDQILTITGATWEDYQKFDSEEYPGHRVSYFQGEIIIVSPGLNHEIIVSVIDRLILAYCDKYDILEFPFRQTRLELAGKAGKEPDIAYSFQNRKAQPDLVVEVIFRSDPGEVSSPKERAISSGNIDALKASYKNIGISELWIWQENKIAFYHLDDRNYQETQFGKILDKIEADSFVKFVNRATSESPSIIKKDFIKII